MLLEVAEAAVERLRNRGWDPDILGSADAAAVAAAAAALTLALRSASIAAVDAVIPVAGSLALLRMVVDSFR